MSDFPTRSRELYGYEQVGSVCDEEAMTDTVRRIQAREWVDRLEATVEAHILPAARVRAACGIPGTSVETAYLCRDKPAMKEALRRAGVPCAQSAGVSSPERGAGVRRRWDSRSSQAAQRRRRRGHVQGLERGRARGGHRPSGLDRGASVAARGVHRGTRGLLRHVDHRRRDRLEFICHYYPGVLEAMRTRWISPYFLTTNRVEAESYAEVKEMGRSVIAPRDRHRRRRTWSGSSARRASSSPRSAAGRPAWVPGTSTAPATISTCTQSGRWRSSTAGARRRPSRRFSAGILNLQTGARRHGSRATADSTRSSDAIGEWIIDSHFRHPGLPTQPVERRLHGQRLDPHAPSRLRSFAGDARGGWAHGPRVCGLERFAAGVLGEEEHRAMARGCGSRISACY